MARSNRIPTRHLAPGSKTWTTFGAQYLVETEAPNGATGYSEIPFQSMKPIKVKCDPDTGEPCARWWTVNVNANEAWRVVPQGTTVTLPSFSDIANVGTPSTNVQLRLRWDGSYVDMDIGPGARVSVLSPTLSAALLVPSRVYVPNSNPKGPGLPGITAPLGGGVVVDAAATLSVTCADAPLGDRIATLTRTYTPLGTDLPQGDLDGLAFNPFVGSAYRIPPRARRVQWSTNVVGYAPAASIGPEYRGLANVAGLGLIRGQYDAWGRAMSAIHDVPKNANYVSLATFDRLADTVTAVWELEM
jgi:hypothetical protein